MDKFTTWLTAYWWRISIWWVLWLSVPLIAMPWVIKGARAYQNWVFG